MFVSHAHRLISLADTCKHARALVCRDGFSVLEMLAAMEKACGHKLAHEMAPRRPGDIATVYADASKAKRELKWQCELSLDQGMADCWRWQSANPQGYE